MTRLRDMNQDQLIAWISTLPFSVANKNKIIKGITLFEVDNGDPVTGSDFFTADAVDLQELTDEAISSNLAKSLLVEINKKKEQDFRGNDDDGKDAKPFYIVVADNMAHEERIKVDKNHTMKDVKKMYQDQYGGPYKFYFTANGRMCHENEKLGELGIKENAVLRCALRMVGGGPFSEYNNDWKIMYQECPVCVRKQRDYLNKGYWYHPGGNKAEFRSSKPGTYAVETKEDKIRCSGCKNECNGTDWIYKCPNHDYEKM